MVTTEILTETSPVAVLQVNSNKEFEFSAADTASSSTSSGRSSMSSFDSNHDPTAPLELGLVINALQTSLTEQQQAEEKEEEQLQQKQPRINNATVASAVVNQQVESPQSAIISSVLLSTTFGSKGLKREGAVIVDYELDHGINNAAAACKDSGSTGSANLIVLDCIDTKSVKPNNLTPREQEKAGKVPLKNYKYSLIFLYVDEPMLRAIHHLFSNQFMKAKKLFEENAQM